MLAGRPQLERRSTGSQSVRLIVNFVDQPAGVERADQRCPTGALHFRRLDGGPQEPVPEATTIQERPNGPLFVRGDVTIFGQDHTLVRQDTRVALCRCGASANKPFCDGSHRRVGFRTG